MAITTAVSATAVSRAEASGNDPCIHRKLTWTTCVFCNTKTMSATIASRPTHSPTYATRPAYASAPMVCTSRSPAVLEAGRSWCPKPVASPVKHVLDG